MSPPGSALVASFGIPPFICRYVQDAGPAPLFRRVAAVFVAPRDLFEQFREHTPWAGTLAISVAVAMVAAASLPASYFADQLRNPVDRLGRPVEVTSSLQTAVLWGRILLAFSAAVMQPLIGFVSAGVLTALFTGLLGGEARYPQYLALVSHVLLIPAFGTLVGLAFSLLQGGVPVEPSLALLLPALDRGGPIFHFLDALNPFTIWALVLTAVGVSTVNRDQSWIGAALPLLAVLILTAAAVAAVS